jgi:hypothetical protein
MVSLRSGLILLRLYPSGTVAAREHDKRFPGSLAAPCFTLPEKLIEHPYECRCKAPEYTSTVRGECLYVKQHQI